MTFSLPDDLASSFTGRVPARDRSRYVADAIADKLAEREKRLIQACEIANQDPEVREIEREFDALSDAMSEPWEHAAGKMPRRGEIWWARLDPTVGSEINKTRPCVVISNNVVNEHRRTVVIVPLSSSPRSAPPLMVSVQCSGQARRGGDRSGARRGQGTAGAPDRKSFG